MNFNSEDWDDTLMLQVFNDAIQKHSTRGKGESKAVNSASSKEVKAVDLNTVENSAGDGQISGKRKRQEDKAKSFKGLMESYYSSKTRQEIGREDPPVQNTRSVPQVSFQVEDTTSNFSSIPQHQSSINPETVPQSLPNPQLGAAVSQEMIDDAMQNMLMAWYHSGYATGRYQTLLEFSHLLPSKIPYPADIENSAQQQQ